MLQPAVEKVLTPEQWAVLEACKNYANDSANGATTDKDSQEASIGELTAKALAEGRTPNYIDFIIDYHIQQKVVRDSVTN